MTNVSAYPISVDGVRLDTLAIGVEESQQTLGGLRSGDQVLAGLDGEVPTLHDSREPGSYALTMLVRGTDEDGRVPFGRAAQAVYQSNLDTLRHLLCQQGSLRTVRRVVDPQTSAAQVNLIPNPAPASTTGWGTAGIALVAAPWDASRTAIRGSATGGTTHYMFSAFSGSTVPGGTPIVMSATIQIPAGKWYRLAVHNRTPNQYLKYSPYTVSDGLPTRVSIAHVLTVDALQLDVAVLIYDDAAGAVLPAGTLTYMGDALLTVGTDTSEPYWDGNSPGGRWEGTPGASASTLTSSDVVAVAKVDDAITPQDMPGDYGRLSARLKLTEGYWRSPDALTATATPVSGVAIPLTPLGGSSAPIDDAITCLTGPASAGVQIVDDATGLGVTLTEALPAGSVWRVNSATWESRVGVGLTVDSADTAGTDKSGVTTWSGTYPRYLRLHPRVSAGRRVVAVRVIGAGFTGATLLALKARRAYL